MEPLVIGTAAGFALLYVAVFGYALTQITKNGSLNYVEKWVWAIALIAVPLLAALTWFVAGPHPLGLRIRANDRL